MRASHAAHTPLRAVVWRRHRDNASLEYAVLSRTARGYEFNGDIVTAHEGEPLRVTYRLRCGADWRSRALTIEQRRGVRAATLRVAVDRHGRWIINGTRSDALSNCADIDLGLSPSTNALPINRLRLSVGAKAEITAAWVVFPGLEVVPVRQSYERRDESTYRYANTDNGFHADLVIDEFGLPITYGSIWERIATRP